MTSLRLNRGHLPPPFQGMWTFDISKSWHSYRLYLVPPLASQLIQPQVYAELQHSAPLSYKTLKAAGSCALSRLLTCCAACTGSSGSSLVCTQACLRLPGSSLEGTNTRTELRHRVLLCRNLQPALFGRLHYLRVWLRRLFRHQAMRCLVMSQSRPTSVSPLARTSR